MEARETPLYDIDTRFAYLPKFRYYDLRAPADCSDESFRLIVFDPPFFYVNLQTLFNAVATVVNHNFKTKLLIAFLKREEAELLRYFHVFDLKPTNFTLEYATVKANKWRNYCLYSNVDLPGIKRIHKK